METKLIENINQFVENYNDLDKDYKVKHNELLVIFDYFKAIINHLYTIMERDKKIIKNISSLFDNNIEIADRSELINKQKYIMNEFETIKQQLKSNIPASLWRWPLHMQVLGRHFAIVEVFDF